MAAVHETVGKAVLTAVTSGVADIGTAAVPSAAAAVAAHNAAVLVHEKVAGQAGAGPAAAAEQATMADCQCGELACAPAASVGRRVLPQQLLSAVLATAAGLDADLACRAAVAGALGPATHARMACRLVAVFAAADGSQPDVLACVGAASLGLPVLLHQALFGCQREHLEDGRLLELSASPVLRNFLGHILQVLLDSVLPLCS